jgi:hypothetical protein
MVVRSTTGTATVTTTSGTPTTTIAGTGTIAGNVFPLDHVRAKSPRVSFANKNYIKVAIVI